MRDIEVRAAIARAPGRPLSVERVELRGLAPHEVLIANKAAGICRTDLSVSDGLLGLELPLVPGHEGVGVVLAVGEQVTLVSEGDHVITALMAECGKCRACLSDRTNACVTSIGLMQDPPFRQDGAPLPVMSFGATFATHTIAPETALAVVPKDVPFDVAALIGCGVSTGVGAVRNTARVEPGSSVVVFGLGSIGLNVVQASRQAGAVSIIAVDLQEHRLDLARQFGATVTLNSSELGDSLRSRILAETGGSGADFAFECVGSPKLLQDALTLVNLFWGVCVAVGEISYSEIISTTGATFAVGRSLLGTFIGGVKPRTGLPQLIADYQAGLLRLDELVTEHVSLEEINTGFRLTREGSGLRTVLMHE